VRAHTWLAPTIFHPPQPPTTLPTHPPLQGFHDALRSALEELRAAKQAAADAFFRRAEGLVAAFHASCAALAERALAAFGAAAGSGSSSGAGGGAKRDGADADALQYDDELYALLADRDALHAAMRASFDARAAALAAAEAAWRAAEAAACAGGVARLRDAEFARNRARIAELDALAAGCRERLLAALDPSTADDAPGGGSSF